MRTYTSLPAIDRLMAKVDKVETGCWLWTGSINRRTGYGSITVNDRAFLPHRVAYEALVGTIPPGLSIDHICRVRTCINPDHLRLATTKQQAENLSPAGRSASGSRNVHWDKRRNRWRVAVTHNGRHYWGGHFNRVEEAALAARELRNSLFTFNVDDRF